MIILSLVYFLVYQSATTLKPPAQYRAGSACKTSTALTCQGLVLRPPGVSGTRTFVVDPLGPECFGVGVGLHGSDLLPYVLKMLDRIEILVIWRLGQHLGLFVVFLEPFLSSFCGESARIVLLDGPLPLGSAVAMKGYARFTTVAGWVVCIKLHPHEWQDQKFSFSSRTR